MKALKLAITFILILAAVVGAFWLIGSGRTTPPPPPPDSVYAEVRAEIENDWEQAGDWNESVFMSHCDLLNQLSEKYETTTLMDLNTRTAAAIIHEKIFNEWERPQCRKLDVDKYFNAIGVIESKDGNAKTDPNIKKIKDVYNTYIAAYNLANKPIVLSPRFDGNSWNSFSAYSESMNNQRSSMLANSNYTAYLANIADIKDGLNAIPGRLETARKGFYSSLATNIINHYSRIDSWERTRENLNDLRNTYSKYQREYSTNERLSSFVSAYARDVADNESKNE